MFALFASACGSSSEGQSTQTSQSTTTTQDESAASKGAKDAEQESTSPDSQSENASSESASEQSASEPDSEQTSSHDHSADGSEESHAHMSDTEGNSEDHGEHDHGEDASGQEGAAESHVHDHGGYAPERWPLTAHGMQLPSTFVDATGAEVTIEKADRVGSMLGAITEVMWTLGFADRLVVIDSTTRYPQDLAELPNVGFFRALPVEGILAQSPDVLLVPLDAGPPEVLDAIEEAGVVVVRFPTDTEDPESLRKTVDLVGNVFGAQEHAALLAHDVLTEFEHVAVQPEADAVVVGYAVARGQNVFLTGLDNPSNALIAAAGFRSLAGELSLESATPLTPEAIVAVNPDVLISTRSSVEQAGGAEAFLAIPGIAETKAAQNNALIIWEDDQSIQLWTPRAPLTVVSLKEQIADLTAE